MKKRLLNEKNQKINRTSMYNIMEGNQAQSNRCITSYHNKTHHIMKCYTISCNAM
jgi:hypothetical protein